MSLSEDFTNALREISERGFAPSGPVRTALAQEIVINPALRSHKFRRHAVAEKANAWTLGQIGSLLKPGELRTKMHDHAADEYKHFQIFEALSEINEYPSTHDFDFLLEKEKSFVASFDGDIVGFICDTLAAEVRTYFSLSAYVEPLRFLETQVQRKYNKALTKVLDDEARHIRYTAHYIDKWFRDGLELSPQLQQSFEVYDSSDWSDVRDTAEFIISHKYRNIALE